MYMHIYSIIYSYNYTYDYDCAKTFASTSF